MKQKKAALIGECMVELRSIDGYFQPAWGGDTLNTAVYLARACGEQCNVAYLTGLGEDGFSQDMLNGWQREHLDTSLVVTLPDKQPGLYTITNLPSGEREFCYWRNDAAARYWLRHIDLDQLTTTLSDYDLIYLSGISLAILPQDCRDNLFSLLKTCRNAGVTIAFDNNYRPRLWPDQATTREVYRDMLKLTDWAFLTLDDEIALYGERDAETVINDTLALGVQEVIIKRGSEDCLVATPSARYCQPAEHISNVIDTTAAGDSFSAAYLSKRLYSDDIDAAIKAGHRLAGTVIQHRGAIIDRDLMP